MIGKAWGKRIDQSSRSRRHLLRWCLLGTVGYDDLSLPINGFNGPFLFPVTVFEGSRMVFRSVIDPNLLVFPRTLVLPYYEFGVIPTPEFSLSLR